MTKSKKFTMLFATAALVALLGITSCKQQPDDAGPFEGTWGYPAIGQWTWDIWTASKIAKETTFSGNTIIKKYVEHSLWYKGTFSYTSGEITFNMTQQSADGKTWTDFADKYTYRYTLSGNTLTLKNEIDTEQKYTLK